MCKRASQKLNALSRIASCMVFDQRRLILNSSITSHFFYCPIVWMFHSRKLNERINHIYERNLRIVYKDFNSSFHKLLIEDNSLNIHHRNLQKIVTEIFKFKMTYHLSSWMMFLSLSKNHTPYEQLRISGRGRSVQQNMAQKHLLTLAPNYGTLFQMNIKLFNHLKILKKKQKLGSQRTALAGYTKHIFTKWVLFNFPAW